MLQSFRFSEVGDKDAWDRLVSSLEDCVPYQSWEMGKLMESILGFSLKRFCVSQGNSTLLLAQVVKRRFFENSFFLHISQGPLFPRGYNEEVLAFFIENLKKEEFFVSNSGCLKVEPRLPYSTFLEESLLGMKFFKSQSVTILHPDKETIVIDLLKSEDGLFKEMHPSAQRSLRKTFKKGVTVRRAKSRKDFDSFWNLFFNTAKRKGFYTFPRDWYFYIYNSPQIKSDIFLAEFNGNKAAAAFLIYFKETALYSFGGSIPVIGLSPLRLLLWETIKYAKNDGFKYFDLMGVDDGAAPGLSRFKRWFGGSKTINIGSYDYIFFDP